LSTGGYSEPAGAAARIGIVLAAVLAFLVLLTLAIFVPYLGLALGAALATLGLLARRRARSRLALAVVAAGAVLFLIGLALAVSYTNGGGTEIQPATPIAR
jgi:hypothetical protein